MSKKGYALVLVYAILTMVAGLVFLFDALGLAFHGAIAHWYLVLLLYIAAGLIAIALIRNAPIYYTFAALFAGIYLSLSMGKVFSEVWPLIPLATSIGLIVSYLTSKKRIKSIYIGLIMLILSAILLIGGITHSWKYVIPAELIIVGFIAIVCVSYKLSKMAKNKTEEEDYHVRPTNEKNKKEE